MPPSDDIDETDGDNFKVNASNLVKLQFALAMLDPPYEDTLLVRSLTEKWLAGFQQQPTYLIHVIDVCWTVCRHKDIFDKEKYASDLRTLFGVLYGKTPTRNRALLAKVFEVNNSLDHEKWANVAKDTVDRNWRNACDEADALGQTKNENSRLHAEIMLKLDQLMKKRKFLRL